MKTTEQLNAIAVYKDMRNQQFLLYSMTLTENIHQTLYEHEYNEEGEPLPIEFPVSNEVYGVVLYIDELLHKDELLTSKDMKSAKSAIKWAIKLCSTYGDEIPLPF